MSKKPLSKEEINKYKPEDQVEKLASVMGFGLGATYDLAINEGATRVSQYGPETKAANVEKLPERASSKGKKK